MKPSGMPISAAMPKPMPTRLQRVQDIPAYALVVRALAVERVAEHTDRRVPGLDRPRQRAVLREDRPHRDEQREPEDDRDHAAEKLRDVVAVALDQRRMPAHRRRSRPRGRRRLRAAAPSPPASRMLPPAPAAPCRTSHALQISPRSCHATLILKLPAYFFGSLPSHTTPSISFEVRKSDFGSDALAAAAACL